jgi:hypothetical protein
MKGAPLFTRRGLPNVSFFFKLAGRSVDCAIVSHLWSSQVDSTIKPGQLEEQRTMIGFGGSQFAHFDEEA